METGKVIAGIAVAGAAGFGIYKLISTKNASEAVRIDSIAFNEAKTLIERGDFITASFTFTNTSGSSISPVFQVVLKKSTEPWDTIIYDQYETQCNPVVPDGQIDFSVSTGAGVPDDWVPGTTLNAVLRVKRDDTWVNLKTSQTFTVQEAGDEFSARKDSVIYNDDNHVAIAGSRFPVEVKFTNIGTVSAAFRFRVVIPAAVVGISTPINGEWVTSSSIAPNTQGTVNLLSGVVPTSWTNGTIFHPYVELDGLDDPFDESVAFTVSNLTIDFAFGQAAASPNSVYAGSVVAISYPITSHSDAVVSGTAEIRIYTGGGFLGTHGDFIRSYQVPFSINPGQTKNITVNHTTIYYDDTSRDVGINLIVNGVNVGSDEDDNIFTVMGTGGGEVTATMSLFTDKQTYNVGEPVVITARTTITGQAITATMTCRVYDETVLLSSSFKTQYLPVGTTDVTFNHVALQRDTSERRVEIELVFNGESTKFDFPDAFYVIGSVSNPYQVYIQVTRATSVLAGADYCWYSYFDPLIGGYVSAQAGGVVGFVRLDIWAEFPSIHSGGFFAIVLYNSVTHEQSAQISSPAVQFDGYSVFTIDAVTGQAVKQ